MHTLQHAPIDCSSNTWSSRLDESEEGIGLCVVPSLVTETIVEGQLPEGFDISMLHRDVCPFCSRSFDTLGFYALGCAHIFHFHCLIQMMMLRSTCMVCTSDIDISLYRSFGLYRYRPVDSIEHLGSSCDIPSSSNVPPAITALICTFICFGILYFILIPYTYYFDTCWFFFSFCPSLWWFSILAPF